MAEYSADFWEIPVDAVVLEHVPADRALWFETEQDRERRYAFEEFFTQVSPAIGGLIEAELTQRQREVVRLYYYHGKTQQDIAVILNLSQSTVSRHLFGTVRDGKKVGGAIPKLQKVIKKKKPRFVREALGALETRLAQPV